MNNNINNINSNSSEKKNQNIYTHILSTHTSYIHTLHISASICKYETYNIYCASILI